MLLTCLISQPPNVYLLLMSRVDGICCSWPLRYNFKDDARVEKKLPSPGSWYSNSNWPIQNCSIGDSTSLENSSLLMAPSPDASMFRKSVCTLWKSKGAQAQQKYNDWCPKCLAIKFYWQYQNYIPPPAQKSIQYVPWRGTISKGK